MNTFRTVVIPEKPDFTISHHDNLVSIGSCFSENTGKKFRDYKFNININPFGQQYNPFSIANAIQRLLNPVEYTGDDLIFHDELFHSFDHHGSFSKSSEEETLALINSNLKQAAADLKRATVLFLTFGTSHIFTLKKQNRIVSNCHKISGSEFERRLMLPDEITEVLETSIKNLLSLNPQMKLVFTVSPVRYFAFGHYENSVSKAHLFTAIYKLQKLYPAIYYFPAYELVMDDLRDYRFFAEDMLHPNYQASDYVWESLSSTLFEQKTRTLLKEIDEILQAAKHKPRNPKSSAHLKFVEKYLEKIEMIKGQHQLNFNTEEMLLSKSINT